MDAETMIRSHIQKSPLVKSKIIKRVKTQMWPGWCSPEFVMWSHHVDKVFQKMVDSGEVIFVPGEKLKLKEES